MNGHRMALVSHHQLKEMGHDPGLSADASGGDSCMNAPANVASNPSAVKAAEVRVTQYNWKGLAEELSSHGCVVLEKLLSADECRQIAGLYPHEGYFRSHIDMARHGFGRGEYRYFKYPLPDLIGNLRGSLSAFGQYRQRLERADEARSTLSFGARGLS